MAGEFELSRKRAIRRRRSVFLQATITGLAQWKPGSVRPDRTGLRAGSQIPESASIQTLDRRSKSSSDLRIARTPDAYPERESRPLECRIADSEALSPSTP